MINLHCSLIDVGRSLQTCMLVVHVGSHYEIGHIRWTHARSGRKGKKKKQYKNILLFVISYNHAFHQGEKTLFAREHLRVYV